MGALPNIPVNGYVYGVCVGVCVEVLRSGYLILGVLPNAMKIPVDSCSLSKVGFGRLEYG